MIANTGSITGRRVFLCVTPSNGKAPASATGAFLRVATLGAERRYLQNGASKMMMGRGIPNSQSNIPRPKPTVTSFLLRHLLTQKKTTGFRLKAPPAQGIFQLSRLSLIGASPPFVLKALIFVAGVQRGQFCKLRARSKDQCFLFHGLDPTRRLTPASGPGSSLDAPPPSSRFGVDALAQGHRIEFGVGRLFLIEIGGEEAHDIFVA